MTEHASETLNCHPISNVLEGYWKPPMVCYGYRPMPACMVLIERRSAFIQSINAANREPINVFRILSQNDSLLWSISDNNLQLWKYHYVRNNDNHIVKIALTLQQNLFASFSGQQPHSCFLSFERWEKPVANHSLRTIGSV